MIDIEILRRDKQRLLHSLNLRGASIDLERIESLDTDIRRVKFALEGKLNIRNTTSKRIGSKDCSPEERSTLVATMQGISAEISELEEQKRKSEQELRTLVLYIPNILDSEVPAGKDEADNVVIKTWGAPKAYDFPVQTHHELAEKLGIMDTPRGVKLAHSRFTLLKGQGARLERALANFMLDVQTGEHGYAECAPPYLVNSEVMEGTGQLPKFKEDMFSITDSDLYLIPTAEVPLTNIHRKEILAEEQLPLQMSALTPCFRQEAGSYGRDTKGYIRQHQFHKVELVWVTRPEDSEAAHQKLISHAESILERLDLPYRRVLLCAGDIGFSAAKCFDLEVWLPGEGKYREISSCSNCRDFQARRMQLKFKSRSAGKNIFAHTLNGSGLAVGRTLIAVLENYQRADGSIAIPKVLQQYMGGLTELA